jgi:outer membrane protein OmpA-like peptidoglycan-associated protein
MKNIVLVILSFTCTHVLHAQETVIWSSEVVDVSTEFSPYEYSAIQVLHRPNVLPRGGENPNAWRPKRTDKEEYIVVSFSDAIKAKQVAIAESENPGSVKEVFAYDEDYNEYQLFELTPRNLPIESRLLNLFFEETSYKIKAIKVVLDGNASPGYNSIDAIGVSASNIPITVLINLAPGINSSIEADKLSANVNSPYPEHSPIISPDGKKMYFSRQYHPDNVGGANDSEDIWVSELNEETGDWSVAKNVGPPLHTSGPNFISSISIVKDEEIFILGNRYGKNGRMYTGVSMTKKTGDTFSKPVDIEIEDEYNYSPNADYFLVPGGKAMLLSAERDDSYGKRDLYVSLQKSDGSWTVPKNLGNQINTTGEDESPFLSSDGKTLYFSTDGYNGYGGADIYVSIKQDDTWTNWSTPENMGSSINKDGDDEYFNIPTGGQHLYFTRGEKGEDTDIYSFKVEDLFIEETPIISSVEHLIPRPVFVTVRGRVIDAKTNEPAENARVIIERLPEGEDLNNVKAHPKTGVFNFTVGGGFRYATLAEADGYISQDGDFDFREYTKSDTIEKNLLIFPIEKGEKIVLRNIFFDFDKAILQEASFPVLQRLVGYLKDDKIDRIEISGHTDSVGSDSYNKTLSGKRAQAVIDYFVKNGVSKDRLEMSAKGESEPIISNDTPENRAQNRRVEFKIL